MYEPDSLTDAFEERFDIFPTQDMCVNQLNQGQLFGHLSVDYDEIKIDQLYAVILLVHAEENVLQLEPLAREVIVQVMLFEIYLAVLRSINQIKLDLLG